MPAIPVLRELLIVASCSLVIILLFNRIRLPAVVGFIVTGVLIGPGGFGLVGEPHTIEVLAELGVVLLLFTVGLEFSLADLRRLGRRALIAGALQMALTTLAALGLLIAARIPAPEALFLGLLVSISSTAVPLKLLSDRNELQAPHGRAAIGIALFQDLAVVPVAALTPLIGAWARGGSTMRVDLQVILHALGTIGIAAVAFVAARRWVPRLLGRASKGQLRDALFLGVVVAVLGSAYLTYVAGLSLALGAFLAGLVLADSDLRAQIAAEVIPFRDSFSSVFFISMGLLFQPAYALRHPGLVLAATVGLVALKLGAIALACRIAGMPWRVAAAAGLVLAQIGEFSFVLSRSGKAAGLMPDPWGQTFYASAVFSLVVTPWLVSHASGWALAVEMALRRFRPQPALPLAEAEGVPASPLLSDHVVIAGFGLNGRNLARVLRAVRVPHIVLDLAPENLALAGAEGSRSLLGDATRPEVLRQAGVSRARVLVLALSDPAATKHASRIAGPMNSRLFIIVRTRYVAEIDDLYAAGANLVIPEEFETSIEIFTAVLREFHVPHNIVQAQIELLRQENYSLLRGRRLPGAVVDQLDSILLRGTTETVLLLQQSPAVGRTLEEAGLLGDTGCNVVAVVRGGSAVTTFDAEFRLRVGDTLVLTGPHAEIDAMLDRLRPARAGA